VAHVVVDAVSDSDLGVIAEACLEMKLMTGGSAVAMPLPGLLGVGGPKAGGALSAPEGGAIVLSGSCSAMTRAQVSAFLQHAKGFRLDPMELASEGVGFVRDWLTKQDPMAPKIIYATAEPASVKAVQGAGRRDLARGTGGRAGCAMDLYAVGWRGDRADVEVGQFRRGELF